jgi:hypothetical protein
MSPQRLPAIPSARAGELARGLRPRAVAVIAIAVALAAGAVLPTESTLAATRRIEIRSETLVLVPTTARFSVCLDQRYPLGVFVEVEVVYRRLNPVGPWKTMKRQPSQSERIIAEVDDPSLVTLAPPFSVTRAGFGWASFKVTGRKAGATTIRIRDDQRRARQVEVRVVVDECVYTVSATSVWQLNFGFNPTAYGRIPDTDLHRTGPDVYEGTAMMQNQAVAAPISGCVPTFKPGQSRVKIKGTIKNQGIGQILMLELTYATVSVRTAVACPPVAGGASNTGKPYTLLTDLPAFETTTLTKIVPGHPMETERGTFESDTKLIVSMIPVPPSLP